MKASELRISHFDTFGTRLTVERADGETFTVEVHRDLDGRFYRVEAAGGKSAVFPNALYSDTTRRLRCVASLVNAATVYDSEEAVDKRDTMNFKSFIATRVEHADICAAMGQDADELGLDTTGKGWVYTGPDGDTYFLVAHADGTFGACIENSEISTYTIEAAEAQLWAYVAPDGDADVAQFMKFARVFSDFNDVLPVIKGFDDSCWGNNSCPSMGIEIEGYEIVLFIDYRNCESREMPQGPQCSLSVNREDGCTGELLNLQFDDVPSNLAEQALCAVYQDWTLANKLPSISADELIFETLTAEQRLWVSNFINMIEAVIA